MCLSSNCELNIKQVNNEFIVKKQFVNLQEFEKSALEDHQLDALALSTQYTKYILSRARQCIENTSKKSNLLMILLKTTQPAHLITFLAVATVAWLLNPNRHHEAISSTMLNMFYLGSFSTYFGTQIWMTFVSGLALYFSIPRHHFGNVQRVLFPKYFTLNSMLCLITLVAYIQLQNANSLLQIIVLTVSFLLNILIRIYLTPRLLKYILLKNQIEEAAGIGMEIGVHDAGPLKYCPQYNRIHKSFRKVHMSIAVGNIITMSCAIIHLYHISSKLCIL